MAVITILFGPVEPDSSFLNAPVASASNALPAPNGYLPAPNLNATRSASLSGIGDCLGACLIKIGQLSYRVYVAQTVGATVSIRSFDSASFGESYTGTEVGTGYTGPDSNERFRFAKFGNFLITVNDNDNPQVLNWSSAGSFSALGGSPPKACGVFAIHDFVFLTGLASNRRKLQWSAINDHTGWTVGTNLSDEQEFPDGGDICGIAGGMSGFVIQKQSIRTYQFLPGDTQNIFSFSKLEGIPGCINLDAWCFANQTLFYLSEEGFCALGPQGFRRIGAHRVDITTKAATAGTAIQTIAIADPFRPFVWFFHPSNPNTRFVYDYHLDRWGLISGISVDDIVDHIEATGGSAQMFIKTAGQEGIYAQDGSRLAASAQTPDLQIFSSGPNAGQRAQIQRIRPIINGAIASVSVSHKESLDDSYVTVTSTTQESNGWFTFGSSQTSGVYHSLGVTTAAGNSMTYLRGLEVDVIPAGDA